ncbi:Seipin family [Trema orientale]|uniref:Seipin family n=1 Tax=Trema orientale TaxID=63057 RepID=A0A2P5FL59_TREOI|nr:Seipin family [Trema orientale]
MDASKIHENSHTGNGEHEELFGLDPTSNGKSLSSFDVLKYSVLKLVLDGAEKAVKDQKALKVKLFLANGVGGSSGLDTTRALREHSFDEKESAVQNSLPDNERVLAKPGNNSLLNSSKDYINNPLLIEDFPSRGNNQLPMNFLAFIVVLLMKFVGFQFSLLISFLTFPIWSSYYVFLMFVLFPLQTMRQVRGYLMKKLSRMCRVTYITVTAAISDRVKAQKSAAVRIGWALFSSICVCSMLLGLLASGFLLGGFMMQHLVQKPIQTRENLNFDYSKTSPVAFVSLTSSHGVNPSGLFFKDDAGDGKQSMTRVIPYNHKLQLTVSLTVPESEYNQKLGVFQVRVDFLSANGNVTASSGYPCMLRFKSRPIRYIETFLKSAPLIAGFQSESQILNIKMTQFVEGIEPTACLRITLEQRAEYQTGAGIPQIYEASLVLESELPKLKRFVWYWRRTIFFWSSLLSFFTELVFIIVFIRPILVPRSRNGYGKNNADRAKIAS